MKKIYTLSILLSFLIFSSCSKDFLKKYDKRIIGTWRITDVDRRGFGGDLDNLPFRDGTFVFSDDGILSYTSPSNQVFQGHWDIIEKTIGEETLKGLEVTVVDYSTQQALSEYYDNMEFTSTDHFKTYIESGLHTYVTHFRR